MPEFHSSSFLMLFHVCFVPLYVIFFKLEHSSNAQSPMLVTLSGIVMLARLEHP